MLSELIRSESIIGLYNPDISDFNYIIDGEMVEITFNISMNDVLIKYKVLVCNKLVKLASYTVGDRVITIDYPNPVPMFSRDEDKPVFWQVFDILINHSEKRNELCMNCGQDLGVKMPRMAICSSEFCGFQAEKYGFGVCDFDEPTTNLLIQLANVAELLPIKYTDREKTALLASIRTQISACGDSQFLIEANSPEKERRFQELLKKHGSIVAYHGSSLKNWIGIIRDGLKHFTDPKNIANGRVYGPGIYCANDENTSRGYSCKSNTSISIVAECEVINIINSEENVAHIKPGHPYIRVINEDYISLRKLLIRSNK